MMGKWAQLKKSCSKFTSAVVGSGITKVNVGKPALSAPCPAHNNNKRFNNGCLL